MISCPQFHRTSKPRAFHVLANVAADLCLVQYAASPPSRHFLFSPLFEISPVDVIPSVWQNEFRTLSKGQVKFWVLYGSMLALLPFRLEHFALDYRNAKSEVLTMVTVKVGVLWNVKPCILVKVYGRSGGGDHLPQFTFPEFWSLCTRNLDFLPSFLTCYSVISSRLCSVTTQETHLFYSPPLFRLSYRIPMVYDWVSLFRGSPYRITVLTGGKVGRDSSVGIATRYWLDSPGIESRCRRIFQQMSRPAMWHTKPPAQWVLGLIPRGKVAGAWGWPPTASSANVWNK